MTLAARALAVSLLTLAPLRPTAAAEPKHYICGRSAEPIVVDGKLDDPAWKTAPWTDDFVDIQGDKKPLPPFRTRVKMAWDDSYFYIIAELEEPHVWGTLTKHDSVIFHDNDFEVFIDPDGDNHQYYEMEINALNTEWDLRLPKPYKDGGPAIDAWEIPGLKTAVHVDGTLNDPSDTDRKWTVEWAIPWKALGEFATCPAPPRDGDAWRVNFSRVEWKHTIDEDKYRKVPNTPEDNWVWSPQGVIDMHRPETWGYVQFTTQAPGSDVAYRSDPSWPARELLHKVYYAQREYQGKNKKPAASIQELGMTLDLPATIDGPPRITLTPDGWLASVSLKPPGSEPETWTIRQDSRIGRAER